MKVLLFVIDLIDNFKNIHISTKMASLSYSSKLISRKNEISLAFNECIASIERHISKVSFGNA